MTDQTTELNNQFKKRSSGGSFTLFLCFCLILAVSFIYYQGFLLKKEFQTELNNYKASNNSIKQLNDKNTQKIIELQNSISTLENQSGQLIRVRSNISLFQLNQLISAAMQSLVVYHDIKNAIKLLIYAKNSIDDNNQAMYTELKFSISEDIAKLEQVDSTDVIGLSGQLEELNSQINVLQSVTPVTLVTKKDSVDNKSKWERFLIDVKDRLFSLVSVSRVDSNAKIILMPDQEYIVKQNIRLNLLNAKMALMLHDEEAWKYSLNNALNALKEYFISDSSYGVKNDKMINTLEKLVKINISDSGVNINKTLKSLNKLNNI
ncbi:MAG TPA: uroporphyrinogen-III C-methyltransferase [Burkholderiales bacterium]|nr:uroporphyrinogen-III C-methyltransferase [Burkholderiales bacterium]